MKFILPLILFSLFTPVLAQVSEEYHSQSPLQRILKTPTTEAPACDGRKEFYTEMPQYSHRIVKQKHGFNKKGGPESYQSGYYLLRRLNQDNYQAILNISFNSRNNLLANDMLERTRSCLKDLKPYLKGPNSENLEILVLTPDEVKQLPKELPKPFKRNIGISEDATERGHTKNFNANFTCQQIGHEILHHLGLVDEYRERSHDNWSCRVVTGIDSYMRNVMYPYHVTVPHVSRCECDTHCQLIMKAPSHIKKMYTSMTVYDFIGSENLLPGSCSAKNLGNSQQVSQMDKAFIELPSAGDSYKFESRIVFGVTQSPYYNIQRTEYTCRCPEEIKDECEKILQQVRRRIALAPMLVGCPHAKKPLSIHVDRRPTPNGSVEVIGKELIIRTPSYLSTLLQPNHFKKIIAGNCVGGAPEYERCSDYAYITKYRGNRISKNCDVPPECLDDDYYLKGNLRTPSSLSKQGKK